MRRNIWKRWIAGISVVMMVMSGMSDVLPTSAAEIASTQASVSSQASSAASEAGTEASVSESEEAEDKVTDTATGLTEDAAAGSEAVSEDAADAASSEENAEVSASASTERSEEYPAVDFGTESAGNMKVSISAPEGAFPKGTTVSVTPVSLGSSVENEVTDQVSGVKIDFKLLNEKIFTATATTDLKVILFTNLNWGRAADEFSTLEVNLKSRDASGNPDGVDSFPLVITRNMISITVKKGTSITFRSGIQYFTQVKTITAF